MTNRKMPKQRRLAFESLETRTLLAVIANGDRGFVEVEWDTTVPPVTHEHFGGPTIGIRVRLHPTLGGVGNTGPVDVSFAAPGEASFSPAQVTFAAGEVTGGAPSAWRHLAMTGLDDFPANPDDGNKAYSIGVTTKSTDPTTSLPDPNFTGIDGAAGSFTNLDDDLKAHPDAGYSLLEMDSSYAPGTVYSLNVGGNDTDLGGDGSWHVIRAWLNVGEGEVYVPGVLPPVRSVSYRPANDWYGDFSIRYLIENEWEETSHTTATGTVVNVPDAPVAEDDGASTAEDTAVDIDPLGNDTDVDNWPVGKAENFGLTVGQIGTVVGGTASIANGKIRFVPAPNWNSVCNSDATIQYKATDPEGYLSNWATVTVEVTPVNDPPEAEDDDALFETGTAICTVEVMGNDTDIDCGDELTMLSWTDPAEGSLQWDAYYASFIYTAFAIETTYVHGHTDTWTYTIQDSAGVESTATVVITWVTSGIGTLVASGTPDGGGAAVQETSLSPIIAEARARWIAIGADASVLDRIDFASPTFPAEVWALTFMIGSSLTPMPLGLAGSSTPRPATIESSAVSDRRSSLLDAAAMPRVASTS